MLFALACGAHGCGPKPVTVVLVRFDSDIARDRVQDVTVTARWSEPGAIDFAERVFSFREVLDDGGMRGFPGSVVITPGDATSGRVLRIEARLTLRNTSSAYVTARADVRVVRDGSVDASLRLSDVCGSSGVSASCAASAPDRSCQALSGMAVCAAVGVQGADAGAM